MFFRRGVAEDDPWLRPKLWIFTVGAILALIGMATETTWVIGVAGGVLAVGVLIRFIPHPAGAAGAAGAAGETGEAGEAEEAGERPPLSDDSGPG